MSRTLSVATPAPLTEKATETQPPTSIGIATMGAVAKLIVVTTPFTVFEYENDPVTLPLLPPVKDAAKLMLTLAELAESSIAAALELGKGVS
jgi:hypothetical protein